MILTVRERTYSSNGQWCREDLAIPLTTAIAASGRHQSCSASSSSQCQEEDCRGGCRPAAKCQFVAFHVMFQSFGSLEDLLIRPPTSAPKLLPPTRCRYVLSIRPISAAQLVHLGVPGAVRHRSGGCTTAVLQQYTVGGTCCCVPRSVPLVAECGVVVHLHCFFSTDRYLNIRAVCSCHEAYLSSITSPFKT